MAYGSNRQLGGQHVCKTTPPPNTSYYQIMVWGYMIGAQYMMGLGLETNKKEKAFLDKEHRRELYIMICLTHLTPVSKSIFFGAWHKALFSFISVQSKRKIYRIYSYPSSCLHDYFIKAGLDERTLHNLLSVESQKVEYTCKTKHT